MDKERLDNLSRGLDNTTDNIDQTVHEIIDFLASGGSIRDQAPLLKSFSEDYVSNEIFVRYVKALIENYRMIMGSEYSKENQELIMNYLRYKHDHIRKVTYAFLNITGKVDGLDLLLIEARMAVHDSDLLDNTDMDRLALNHAIRKGHIQVSKELKTSAIMEHQAHHYRSRHHIEYFIQNEIDPDIIDKIEIVADVFDEQPTKEAFIQDLMKEIDIEGVKTELRNDLIQLARRLTFNKWLI